MKQFIIEEEVHTLLYRALESLPAKCRKVFELSCIEGLKYKDIAGDLQISVNTAGNHGEDIDKNVFYPTDRLDGEQVVNNMITVGSITYLLDINLVSKFSNYGKKQVDIFAPGSQVYSTVLENEYKFYDGTSLAAPYVSGVAALVRPYYPALSAGEVKKLIMDSGVAYKGKVIRPGEIYKTLPFASLSVSGKILNAFDAVVMAEAIMDESTIINVNIV